MPSLVKLFTAAKRNLWWSGLTAGLIVGGLSLTAEELSLEVAGAQARWTGAEAVGPARLIVDGPASLRLEKTFLEGQALTLWMTEAGSQPMAGLYRWRLELPGAHFESSRPAVRSGHLFYRDGQWHLPLQLPTKDHQIQDDLIVQGNACVGVDCVDGEAFASDILRIKAERPILRFEDSSEVGADGDEVTTADWQLVANDGHINGLNRFSIEDLEQGAGVAPFSIASGAPQDSFVLDSNGHLGLGTSIPASDLHVVDGSRPTLRLEQDTTEGLPAHSWDLINFGPAVGFLKEGADSLALEVTDQGVVFVDGNMVALGAVEIGGGDWELESSEDGTLQFTERGNITPSLELDPDGNLDIAGTFDMGPLVTDSLTVQNIDSGREHRELAVLKNDGWLTLRMEDIAGSKSGDPAIWNLTNKGDHFEISNAGTQNQELVLSEEGKLTINGPRASFQLGRNSGQFWLQSLGDNGDLSVESFYDYKREAEFLFSRSGDLRVPGDLTVGEVTAFAVSSDYLTVAGDDGATLVAIEESHYENTQRVLLKLENNGSPTLQMADSSLNNKWNLSAKSQGFEVSKGGTGISEMILDASGNLTIVGGLTTAADTYPDYVFREGYELMPLDDLQIFIESFGHLPNVPSEEDTDYGRRIDMTELQIRMLEKVEELTLYTLEQHRTIREQRSRLEAQQDLLERQSASMQVLEDRLAVVEGRLD